MMNHNPDSTNFSENASKIQSSPKSYSFSSVTTSSLHAINITVNVLWRTTGLKAWFLSLQQNPDRPNNSKIATYDDLLQFSKS